MSTEGSREIEAARKRLAAAKVYESSASTNVKKAISMMNNANSMVVQSSNVGMRTCGDQIKHALEYLNTTKECVSCIGQTC